jgi:hypothetical protein
MEELAAYFYRSVFLAYDQYRQVKNSEAMGDDRDRREAIAAATALYHLREHIPRGFRKSRAELAALCPDYDLLGDVVNAAKHGVLNHGNPRVADASSISEVMVCTRYEDREGEYYSAEKTVEVGLIDGSKRDLHEILTNVVNMWFDELHRMGAIDRRDPIQLDRPRPVPREDATSLPLQLTKGLQWTLQLRLQQYNYETDTIEPVDLTDAGITFTIRKPRTFDVQMGDDSGLLLTREVELTPEQARELDQIDDPDRRDQYLRKIAVTQGVVYQMMAQHLRAAKEK